MQSVYDKQFFLFCQGYDLISERLAYWYGKPFLEIATVIKHFR